MLSQHWIYCLQICNFITNTTAVALARDFTAKSPEINFRIAESSFSLNTSDQQTKVIYFIGKPLCFLDALENKIPNKFLPHHVQ